MDDDKDPILEKMEIYHCIKGEDDPLPCSVCKSADAEFETGVWYDGQDPDKDDPYTEMICGVCLTVQLLEESTIEHVILEKTGGMVSVGRGIPE